MNWGSIHWGKSRIFLVLCGSFAVGIFFAPLISFVTAALAALFFIILVSVFWESRILRLAGFAGLVILIGVWRFNAHLPDESAADFIGQYYEQEVTIEGIVWQDPDVRSDKVNLTVKPITISTSPLTSLDLRPLSPGQERVMLKKSLASPSSGEGVVGNILLNVGRYPEYQYGDRLKVGGKVEEPFVSEEFSYKDYLSRFGTYATMRFPDIEVLEKKQGNFVKAGLLAVKRKFLSVISQILPEPHGAFILGLIIGLKKAIPEDLNQAFIITGVSHIVVVSGYNISLITRSLLKTRSWWGRRLAFAISILAVLGFVVITGAEASVVRAASMGLLLVLAMNVGRVYYVVNALVLVGAGMIALNPQILRFDVGFQLSFLATLGLILLSPIFEKWFSRVPNFLEFRTNLASTLAAQVFVLPLLIFYFDRVSLVAPLVNILVLWAIPYTMFFGIFVGVVGILYLPLGQIFAPLAWVLLEYMIWVVEFFAVLPMASSFAEINVPIMIAFYLVLGVWLWRFRRSRKFYQQLEYSDNQV